jgi:hypothetical protein
VISSFQFGDSSFTVDIGELNPLNDNDEPGPRMNNLWQSGDVIHSVFWVWHCTFVLYCFDERFPNIEFISLDNQLGQYHGQFVLATLKVDKCNNDHVLIKTYTINGSMDSAKAFFCPDNILQLVTGVVEHKTKTDHIVIVSIRNNKGLYKVFINALNPKFVNTDHVLNQDSIMKGDEVSMLVNEVKIGNKNQLAVLNEYSILITRPASKRIKKCRIRSVRINSLIFNLTTLPDYHPKILSEILEVGSLEEVSRFYFTVDQRIAIDKYLQSIDAKYRPLFKTSMETEYFELLNCSKHLEVHHPLTLNRLALSNVFHSLSSITLTTDEEVKCLLAIQKLLVKALDPESYWNLVKNVLYSAIINSRHKDNIYAKQFALNLLSSIFDLPHSDCINAFLMELLASYPTNGMNLHLEPNSSIIIETIFRYFYQNHSCSSVRTFVDTNSQTLCTLSTSLKNQMTNPEIANQIALVTCSLSSE